MKATIILLLCLASWVSAASKTSAKQTKRGIYDDGTLYGTHGILATDAINAHNFDFLKEPATLSYTSTNPSGFDFTTGSHHITSFLNSASPNHYEDYFMKSHPADYGSFRPLPAAAWGLGKTYPTYDYPQPQGVRLLEEPTPRFFDYVIPSAIRPRPRALSKVDPTGRRITAQYSQAYQFAGVPAEPSITVRLPIGNARPTRIVVPQHGTVALGSGGLGYRTLPGGRIVMGSGSISFANLALARARPLPPLPPYMPSNLKASQFSFAPEFSLQQRSFETSPLPEETQPSSLTVFPQTNDPLTLALANSG